MDLWNDPNEDIAANLTSLDDIDGLYLRSEPRIPEKRLSSPITNGLTVRLETLRLEIWNAISRSKGSEVGRYSQRLHDMDTYMNRHPEKDFSSIRRPLKQYHLILSNLNKIPVLCTPKHYPKLFREFHHNQVRFHKDITTAAEAYNHVVQSYINDISDVCKPPMLAELKKKLQMNTNQDQRHRLAVHYLRSHFWDQVVEAYRRAYNRLSSNPVQKAIIENRVFFFGTGFAVGIMESETLLFTYEQLQMLQDATKARESVHVALELGINNGTPELPKLVTRLFSWQDRCLETYDNNGYDLVKGPESIFKAKLNSLTDGDILYQSSYSRTLLKLKKKESKFDSCTPLCRSLDSIVEDTHSIHDAAELFGLTKLAGHPIVYAASSAHSVKSEALPHGTAKTPRILDLRRMFRHITISAYIDKHQDWPPFATEPMYGSVLRRHYMNRVTTLPLNSYPLSDLDHVKFAPFCTFDYSEDYLKFLDDKAICPGASETGRFWFGGQEGESRRLLTKILSLKTFDTVALVERMRYGKTTREEEVVELTQKERELKIAARCFCKLTFDVRCFFTLTEYNLGEHFMKQYFPQQTMTMANTEIKTRLYNMVRKANRREQALLEVDFSRWNLRWRQDTVHPIAYELEDIFGLSGVFSQAHPFFYRSTIVLTDKHTLPKGATANTSVHDWPDSDLVWRKHRGGFEGIQQKLWTICTVCMMYVVMQDSNCSFLMAGQGDNQIFSISFNVKTAEQIRHALVRLLGVMEVRCADLNHEVKPEECIDSFTVLTYSKELYVEGVHILYSLKFLSRTLSRIDSDVPSLSKELSMVSATAVMVADTLRSSFQGYFWQCFQVLRLLSARFMSPNFTSEHHLLRQIIDGPKHHIQFYLMLPSSLGGLPIQSWGRFFLKGESDELAYDVHSYKQCTWAPLIRRDLQLLLNGTYSRYRPDPEALIDNPTSIPLSKPKDSMAMIKDDVSSKLPGICTNKELQSIISSDCENAGVLLKRQLCKFEPFYPSILEDIVSYSPYGLRQNILNRFNMTKTIKLVTKSVNYVQQTSQANRELLRYVITRCRNAERKVSGADIPTDTYQICKILRSQWGKRVEHRNVGTFCVLDAHLTRANDRSKPRIVCRSRTPMNDFLDSVGPHAPNFGTKTRAKIADHGYKIVTSSSTIGDLRALSIIGSELGQDPFLIESLSTITEARCGITFRGLQTIMPSVYGGTAAHRHDKLQKASFAILGSSTVPTHLSFSSDSSGYLSGGKQDYPFVFQEAYLYMTNVAQLLSSTQSIYGEKCLNLCLELPGKMETISDAPLSLVENPQDLTTSTPTAFTKSIVWPLLKGNPLAYATRFQFRSIPDIPDAYLFPHISKPKDIRSLVVSYLLNTFDLRTNLFQDLRASVLQPMELFDIAELSSANLAELLDAVSVYVAIESVYHALKINVSKPIVELHDIMKSISDALSGPLCRQLLHPIFKDRKILHDIGVVLRPGLFGALTAVDALSGYILENSIMYLKSKTITEGWCDFYVFADNTMKLGPIIHKLWLYYVSTTVASDRIVLTYEDRSRMIGNQINCGRYGDSPVEGIMMWNALQAIHDNRMLHRGKRQRGTFKMPVLNYFNVDAKEAIRWCRTQAATLNVQVEKPKIMSMFKSTMDKGRLHYKVTGQIGTLLPNCDCALVDEGLGKGTVRNRELFADRLFRPVGRYATSLTTWLHCLQSEVKALNRATKVYSIGVGHGSVATAVCELAKRDVIGVDLYETLPACSHRDTSYVPPEIKASSNDELFQWHDAVFEEGGDIFDVATELDATEGNNYFIVDIETNALDVVSLLALFSPRHTIAVRLHCCECRLRQIIDAVRPSVVYCTSVLRKAKVLSYVLIFSPTGMPVQSGNYERIAITSTRAFKPRFDRDVSRAHNKINDMLKPSGKSIDQHNSKSLQNTNKIIRQHAMNSNSPTLRQSYLRLCAMLQTLDAAQHMTTRELVSYVDQEEDRHVLRIVASTLCETLPENAKEDILSQMRS